MTAYYNEFKPEAAHMLRQLIKDGLIAPGDVDERSITEVKPDDLIGYTQCHFFAGIGGWSAALRLAGWDDTRPVWTGSCPCQPFSTAGNKKGQSDERHLWPVWFGLIRQCRPSIVFGEQVAAAIAHGWWDDVAYDLEGEGYACGAAVLPACSVGKAHKRDRLWFVADSSMCDDGGKPRRYEGKGNQEWLQERDEYRQSCKPGHIIMANTEGREKQSSAKGGLLAEFSSEGNGSTSSNVADPSSIRYERSAFTRSHYAENERVNTRCALGGNDSAEWIDCPDGKSRPVKSGIRLLAHGVQHRAPILHAFGNAIVPALAQKFIESTKGLVW